MNTFQELYQQVQSDLNITTNSSLFPESLVKDTVNRAYIRAASLFRWPKLADALKTSTQLNQEYYDQPETWFPDSVWRLEVDDEMYGEDPDGSPMDFNDYLLWKEDNENSTEKKWALYYPYYFIYPTPTAVGNNNISVWGQRKVAELSADGDETIFSNSMPECNDAIILEAVGILKNKGENEKSGQFISATAKQILAIAFNKVKQEQAKKEKTQPFWEVDDMFSNNSSTEQITGNF